MYPCHQSLGHLLSKSGHEIFHMHSDLSAFCAYEDETGTDESGTISVDTKELKNGSSLCHV